MRGRKTSCGYERVAVARPSVVGEYNRFMGDQFIGYYSTCKRSAKWYKKILYHFF